MARDRYEFHVKTEEDTSDGTNLNPVQNGKHSSDFNENNLNIPNDVNTIPLSPLLSPRLGLR